MHAVDHDYAVVNVAKRDGCDYIVSDNRAANRATATGQEPRGLGSRVALGEEREERALDDEIVVDHAFSLI
ncbi:unnamed protein product, partial [Symbiodinium sp. KB8]